MSHPNKVKPSSKQWMTLFRNGAASTILLLFRVAGHQSRLPVTGLKGAFLLQVINTQRATIPDWPAEAMVKTTHDEHLRYLRTVALSLNDEERQQPLDEAITRCIKRIKEVRGWKWSTTLKAAASLQGALSMLPLYFNHVGRIILTPDSVLWSNTMRYLGQRAREEKPQQPKPATIAQMEKTVSLFESKNRPDIATAILLGWITASRLGCVLQLHKEDIVFNTNNSVSITFRRGKGVKARGPYTVHAPQVPESLLNLLITYHNSRNTKMFSQAVKGSTLCMALRQVSPDLEQRSIRRGALQCMAKAGVTEETLMRFSGHTQVSTLRRYLNWNAVNTKVAQEMQSAGEALMQL